MQWSSSLYIIWPLNICAPYSQNYLKLSCRSLRNTATNWRVPKKSYYNLFFGSFKVIFIVNNPAMNTFLTCNFVF